MAELWGWFVAASGTTGVLGMLAGRFLRTREQKGSDMADMLTKISEAFEKTLATTMKYSTDVIEKMRTDEDRSESRYRELEGRCLKLEQRLEDRDAIATALPSGGTTTVRLNGKDTDVSNDVLLHLILWNLS